MKRTNFFRVDPLVMSAERVMATRCKACLRSGARTTVKPGFEVCTCGALLKVNGNGDVVKVCTGDLSRVVKITDGGGIPVGPHGSLTDCVSDIEPPSAA